MSSVHNTPKKFKNVTIKDHFGFLFEENSDRGISVLSIVTSSISKRFAFKMISAKLTFSDSSGSKSVFEIKSSVFVTD